LSISMKLITTGCLLSIGFWAGRSITNKLDIYMATHNKNLVRDIQNELGV
jgi:hypothetical protein